MNGNEGETMSDYVVIKVKKLYLIMIVVVVVLICGFSGYYYWCSYHPDFQIVISDGPTGKEGIEMEAPHISITSNGIAAPAASIEMKGSNLVMQHEFICTYIKDSYKTSDIKLNIESTDDLLILHYSGIVTTMDGQTEDYQKDIPLDYTIDAKITHK